MHKVSSVGSSQLQKHIPETLHDLLAGTQHYTVAGREVTDVDGMPFASSAPQQFGHSERTGGLTKFGFNSLGNMLSGPKYPGRHHESTAETTKILVQPSFNKRRGSSNQHGPHVFPELQVGGGVAHGHQPYLI